MGRFKIGTNIIINLSVRQALPVKQFILDIEIQQPI